MKKKQTATKPNKQVKIAQRGCGWPIAGGTYLYSDLNSTPIWDFVLDPVVPIDESFISISSIGMVLKPRTGSKGQTVYDLFDIVGGAAYPNPLDWVFEVEKLGFHQKVNPEHMKWLSEESYYFGIHARAGYREPTLHYLRRVQHPVYPLCPGGHKDHLDLPQVDGNVGDLLHLGTCPGLWASDVIKGTMPKDGHRETVRTMPSFEWDGYVDALANIKEPSWYQPSIFFRMPIGRIADILVYEDPAMHTEEEALKILEKLDAKFNRVRTVQL